MTSKPDIVEQALALIETMDEDELDWFHTEYMSTSDPVPLSIPSSGLALTKSTRPDGRTTYRIVTDEPEPETKPARKRAARRSPERVEATA